MSEEKQREKQKAYEKYVKKITPVHNLPLNMLKAFLTGGLICVLGQLILNAESIPDWRTDLCSRSAYPEC